MKSHLVNRARKTSKKNGGTSLMRLESVPTERLREESRVMVAAQRADPSWSDKQAARRAFLGGYECEGEKGE